MPDERQESIERGIAPPPESPAAARAQRERLEELRRTAADAPPLEGAMGGTSDADSAADEARTNAALRAARPTDQDTPAGGESG